MRKQPFETALKLLVPLQAWTLQGHQRCYKGVHDSTGYLNFTIWSILPLELLRKPFTPPQSESL
jgi:hypothetical protein